MGLNVSGRKVSGAQGRWAGQGGWGAGGLYKVLGFGAQCLGRKVRGAGRGALGGARGLRGGRGWARGALGTATRAAAPGDGLRAEARGAGAARRPFYRPQTILSPPMVKANGRFIKRGQPVDHFIARRPFSRLFIKPRQRARRRARGRPVDRFIARRPFYRPQWPFYQGQWPFYQAKAARRPFYHP